MRAAKWLMGGLILGLLVISYQRWGIKGLAVSSSGLIMWGLLHITRLMTVLKRAADRPKGHVDSAVMLNARLRPGVNLLHVMALTRSLGEPLSAQGAEPEIYAWTDTGGSRVTCHFQAGRLASWELHRPAP